MMSSNVLTAFRERPIHEALKPLEWLIGRWVSEAPALGTLVPGKTFNYYEDLEFVSYGQPVLNYRSITWNPDTNEPMHMESGFLRIVPGTPRLSLLVAHKFGVTTVEEGSVAGQTINLKSGDIGHMATPKEPLVTKIERNLKLNSEGFLEQVLFMETTKQPLTEHLKAVYKKVPA